jgi:hypothetical protein
MQRFRLPSDALQLPFELPQFVTRKAREYFVHRRNVRSKDWRDNALSTSCQSNDANPAVLRALDAADQAFGDKPIDRPHSRRGHGRIFTYKRADSTGAPAPIQWKHTQ